MRKAISILALAILFWSCKNNNNSSETGATFIGTVDSLKPASTTATREAFDIIYESELVKLYGDTSIEERKIHYATLKFEPYIWFDDFKVNTIDHRRSAPLNLQSNKLANMYRSRLKEGYAADKANFAGHYSLVYWGCGSPCKLSMVIDRKTGLIYDAPDATRGYEFRVDSRMLIINPPDSGGFYWDCGWCKPSIYLFNEQSKKFQELSPKGAWN